jgi:hypothetical protein
MLGSERKLWALSALVFMVLTALISVTLWFLVSSTFVERCSEALNAAFWQRCTDRQNFALDRAALLSAVVGIAISAVGTIALLITIIYTARATTAAMEASKSAKAALDIAKESQLLDLRPYINLSDVSQTYSLDEEGKISSRSMRLVWENVGNTPALNVHASINHEFFDDPIPDNFLFTDNMPYGTHAGTVGKDKQIASNGVPISLYEIQNVINGRKKMHLWGWVEYEGFEGLRRYRTEYHCSITFYMAKDAADEKLAIWYIIADRFNGSDETCTIRPKTRLASRHRNKTI